MAEATKSVQISQRHKSLGHYVLGKTIGEGTFGKVKVGTHVLTGEKVAVKILEKDRVVDTSDVERVSREIHILSIVRHPNIIQLFEIVETAKQLYLITEYAAGGELYEYIVVNNRLKEPEACRLFQQVVAGVEYIHKLKIVHRDLKPENLLLNYAKDVKVVDFGLSNTYKQDERLKTACGSPCYAAPEMIANKKYDGLQVDIWSAGVVLFALLCGFLPFEDPDTSSLYKKILAGNYMIPSFLSEEAKGMIRGMLNIDPRKRFGIEEIKRHPWFGVSPVKAKEGIIVGVHQIPTESCVLQKLGDYGFDPEYTKKCIEANKHNAATTTYYLLLQKFVREGGKTSADLSSPLFVPAQIGKNHRTLREASQRAKLKFFTNGNTTPHPPTQRTSDFSVRRNHAEYGRVHKLEGTGGSSSNDAEPFRKSIDTVCFKPELTPKEPLVDSKLRKYILSLTANFADDQRNRLNVSVDTASSHRKGNKIRLLSHDERVIFQNPLSTRIHAGFATQARPNPPIRGKPISTSVSPSISMPRSPKPLSFSPGKVRGALDNYKLLANTYQTTGNRFVTRLPTKVHSAAINRRTK
eukprot:TRINITY_DN6028_c0_g1_i8.p1 TRINITY_DN6028_c0_g1~~TRINITY_DN6028_c0_g1_i8.p1  ORF type:complete len:580 (+),score=128.01 TRINITY_DN6028_c0_g1_i8:153-1892(+)